MKTDPTPSPQVRDVDRELADRIHRSIEGWMNEDHVAFVIARHLAPEREEAERLRDAWMDAERRCQNLTLMLRRLAKKPESYTPDEIQDALKRFGYRASPCNRSEAHRVGSPFYRGAPAPQGERGGA